MRENVLLESWKEKRRDICNQPLSRLAINLVQLSYQLYSQKLRGWISLWWGWCCQNLIARNREGWASDHFSPALSAKPAKVPSSRSAASNKLPTLRSLPATLVNRELASMSMN